MEQRAPRMDVRARMLAALGLMGLMMALMSGCGSSAARNGPPASAATSTPFLAPTATLAPTMTVAATPYGDCQAANGDPGDVISSNLPLPPHTVSLRQPGAAGAGYFLECTPGVTAASISAYLNASFPQAGWRAWNPATDNAGGCGTQANDFWRWQKDNVAVGWNLQAFPLPQWMVAACSLAYATPQA